MNLWAKIVKQLAFVSVALLFFACEDESSFLGLKNPNRKFEVYVVDIPLSSSVIEVDSVYTDNKTISGGVLVGSFADATLGPVSARAFLHVVPARADTLPSAATFDSLTIQLRSNFYSYGAAGQQIQSFTVHRLNSGTFPLSSADRYTASSSFPFEEQALGQLSLPVDADRFAAQSIVTTTQQDTLLARAKLPDDLGSQIFQLAKQFDFDTNAEREAFIAAIPGLALVPAAGNVVSGFRLDGLSKLTLHYRALRDGSIQNLTRDYNFTTATFSNLEADRSSTDLSDAGLPYREIPIESSNRYVQSGVPVVTRIDLEKYYEFLSVDSVRDILINEVRMIVSDVETPEGLQPHRALGLKLINRNGYFYNYAVASERQALAREFVVPSIQLRDANFNHFFVPGEGTQSPAVLGYNQSTSQYQANLTSFAQVLLDRERNATATRPERVNFLGLVPLNPSTNFSATRTVFPSDGIKLRIYYTKPVN